MHVVPGQTPGQTRASLRMELRHASSGRGAREFSSESFSLGGGVKAANIYSLEPIHMLISDSEGMPSCLWVRRRTHNSFPPPAASTSAARPFGLRSVCISTARRCSGSRRLLREAVRVRVRVGVGVGVRGLGLGLGGWGWGEGELLREADEEDSSIGSVEDLRGGRRWLRLGLGPGLR